MIPDRNGVSILDNSLEATRLARRYNEWVYGRARPYLGRRVLDFGAGIGTFTALAAADARRVVALEPDPRYARIVHDALAANPGVAVVCSTIEEFRATEPEPFDSVICFNVLEHVEDDVSAMRVARDLVVPGGHVLVLAPAHPFLFSDVDGALGHVRRYRRARLLRVFGEAGLDVTRVRYVNPVGALGWFVTFRLRRAQQWPRRQNRAFDCLVPALRILDRLTLPVGLSVWGVARRPAAASPRRCAEAQDAHEERREHTLKTDRDERQPEQAERGVGHTVQVSHDGQSDAE